MLGLVLYATDISYDEASGGVRDDVIRSFPCNLVVKVSELQAGLALYAFGCCNEPTVFARAVLGLGKLSLEPTKGLVSLSPDSTCFAAVDDRDVDSRLVHLSTATLNEHGETFNVSTAGTNAMATLCVASRSCQGRKSSM